MEPLRMSVSPSTARKRLSVSLSGDSVQDEGDRVLFSRPWDSDVSEGSGDGDGAPPSPIGAWKTRSQRLSSVPTVSEEEVGGSAEAEAAAGSAQQRRGLRSASGFNQISSAALAEAAACRGVDSDGEADESFGRGVRRPSVAGRRASSTSRYYALSSTSIPFIKKDLRPTLVTAALFFREPRPDIIKLRQVIAERLLQIPRFRSVFRLNDLSGAVQWDPLPRQEVNMRYHLKTADAKKKTDDDMVEELISTAYLTDWFIEKPLWQMTLVTNLASDRSMLFCVFDHAIGDSVALMSVILSLFDDMSLNLNSREKKIGANQCDMQDLPNWRWSHKLTCFLKGFCQGFLGKPSDMHNSLKIPYELYLRECPGKHFIRTKSFDLGKINSIASKMAGTTIDDIVLAIITMGIRKFFEKQSDPVLTKFWKSPFVSATFPVALGSDKSITDLGNHIAMANFPFPLECRDPIDAVWRCNALSQEIKCSPGLMMGKKRSDLFRWLANEKQLAEGAIQADNQSTCLIDHIKVPEEKIAVAGYHLDDMIFAQTRGGGLYMGVLSHRGALTISLVIDYRVEGNLKELKNCLECAYGDLIMSAEEIRDTVFPPDMTPFPANVLELFVFVAVIALPVVVAWCYIH